MGKNGAKTIKQVYHCPDGREYTVSFKYSGWKYEDTKEEWDRGKRILNEDGKEKAPSKPPVEQRDNTALVKAIFKAFVYHKTPDYWPDGTIDCVDIAIYFYEEWRKKGGSMSDIKIMWNLTPAGRGLDEMNHMFVQVRID
ncbi:MAG: hypothetical protein LBC77_03210 [Spirochaetaceae bacterium]|nr:hypothetical protein [Spirochaetaceae bacterium]